MSDYDLFNGSLRAHGFGAWDLDVPHQVWRSSARCGALATIRVSIFAPDRYVLMVECSGNYPMHRRVRSVDEGRELADQLLAQARP